MEMVFCRTHVVTQPWHTCHNSVNGAYPTVGVTPRPRRLESGAIYCLIANNCCACFAGGGLLLPSSAEPLPALTIVFDNLN